MVRALVLSLFLAGCGLLYACSDQGDAPSSPEPLTAEEQAARDLELTGGGNDPIARLIVQLFPPPFRFIGLLKYVGIQFALHVGRDDLAFEGALRLIDLIDELGDRNKLRNPNGNRPPTTEEAEAELIARLLELVGGNAFSDFISPEELADPNFGWGICDPSSDCTITNESGLAGIRVFEGSTNETKIIKFNQEEFDPDRFPGFKAFPFIYFFEARGASDVFSEGLALASEDVLYDPPAIAGVCVAEAPFPGAPNEEELEFLQLARLDEDSEEVELLPIENADFLSDEDCEEASMALAPLPYRVFAAFEPVSEFFVSPLRANPGRLGGAIAAHSPVGPVDNRGDGDDLIPTTTTLELEESQSCCGFITGAFANVNEDTEGGGAVFPGDVEFVIDEIEGDNDQSTVRALDDGGGADIEIVCDGFVTGDQIGVEQGSYTVQANFLESGTHEGSSSEPESFDCVEG
jgi:hypothetical protein